MKIVDEITLVFAQPSLALSLNKSNSIHWAQRKRYLEPWRLAIAAAYIRTNVLTGLPDNTPLDIQFTFSFPSNIRRDPHNYVATVKPLVDELVNLDLVPDDTAEWLSVKEPILVVNKENLCYVKITVRSNSESDRN